MVESCGNPSDWRVATVAAFGQTHQDVIESLRTGDIFRVATFAFDACVLKDGIAGVGVTRGAVDRGVATDEREARARVFGDHLQRLPGVFVVALFTERAEPAAVNILVTTATTLLGERANRAAIVVTSQALRLRVRTVEGDAGLRFVIESKVGLQLVPRTGFMAQRAVGRKGVVRNHGAEIWIPSLARHEIGASNNARVGDQGEDDLAGSSHGNFRS